MTSRLSDVAAMFDGARLTLARNLAGMRKNALAERIGKSPTAVAGYENALKHPAPATVAQLALALQVDPEFFLPRPQGAVGGIPHFRSLRSTSQLLRDQAHAYGRMAADVAAAIERHVQLPERDIPFYPVTEDSDDNGAPEQAARQLRKEWGLSAGPIGHLVRAVENRGALAVFTPRRTAEVDAYSLESLHRPVILLNPIKDDYFRQRFDVAHELGHLVMHADAEPGGRIVEAQANRFAAELLMPAAQIVDHLPARADWGVLERLKQYWNVSLQALLYRARSLEVMREVTYRNAMASMTQRGWRRREPGAMPMVEQPSLLAAAVELLEREAGVGQHQLAAECGVPLALFTMVTARIPEGSGEPDESEGGSLLALPKPGGR